MCYIHKTVIKYFLLKKKCFHVVDTVRNQFKFLQSDENPKKKKKPGKLIEQRNVNTLNEFFECLTTAEEQTLFARSSDWAPKQTGTYFRSRGVTRQKSQ